MPEGSVPSEVREYRLKFDIDYHQQSFGGEVEADLVATGDRVTLNSVGLEISAARWNGAPAPFELDAAREELNVHASGPGLGRVGVRFQGAVVPKSQVGLYSSRFGDGYVLTTQLAATAARRLFPCVDRPDRRAVFRLELTTDVGLPAIFNTPSTERRDEGGKTRWRFEPTPSMPTYLLFLGVGPFVFEQRKVGSVLLSVALPASRRGSGSYALELTSKILPAYEEYFQIPYPLPKLDLIAVPEMSAGAMENWGAITFRDSRLLVEDSTPTAQKEDTRTTITHELAHMWFGNLVTMAWWDDIWLNESFASALEPRIVSRVYPEARPYDEFLLNWTATGLFGDSFAATHPIVAPVNDPSDIAEVFDEISYGKGSSVLRMIEGYLGEGTFRQGVTDYLNRFRYGNAHGADLWSALERASGQPMGQTLGAWTGRPGLPVVAVRETPSGWSLSQRRFGIEGPLPDGPWPIPMVANVEGREERILFDGPEMEIPSRGDRSLLLNRQALGFYRVLYDRAGYDRLLAHFPTLVPEDRFAILVDLYAFLLSGDIDLERYLGFIEASTASTQRLVVEEVTRQMVGRASPHEPLALHFLLAGNTSYRRVTGLFLREQYHRLVDHRSAEEPASNGALRAIVTRAYVWNDDQFAREFATRYTEWDALDPDLRGAAALAYARTGGAIERSRLMDHLRATEAEGMADRLESALLAFSDPDLVNSTLGLLRSELFNRSHLSGMLGRAAMNPDGREVTFRWLRENLDAVSQDLEGSGLLSPLLVRTCPYLSVGRTAEMTEFLSTHRWKEGERGRVKALALVRTVDRLRQRYG